MLTSDLHWRKSGRSYNNGGDCVEVADLGLVEWRKSNRSTDIGGNCVEVAGLPQLASTWRKGSRSFNNGGDCVEVAGLPHSGSEWHKSSHSYDNGGQCVEVARLTPAIALRDSKDPDGAKLILPSKAWRELVARISEGSLDLG
ncbi:DUF397 domain-containing protein [Actinomadura parmotrematis]|uniref:DUF397 domain-containing protein n=1 Tax=Actinomadura parmotrematis TaxID=2864039 RepID=A0ABS7FUR4_9ACTN|nr:DUF397 domain-containing protein [Actinomadura parmotrematis]MBW8483459.1 DUF397 domain-containing protein [Actinomadura parmotrematis]